MYASLELSKELYEVSGWRDEAWWYQKDAIEGGVIISSKARPGDIWVNLCPAYGLGYLLRKLPQDFGVGTALTIKCLGPVWEAYYDGEPTGIGGTAETPEDAVAALCIKLINQGILPVEEMK